MTNFFFQNQGPKGPPNFNLTRCTAKDAEALEAVANSLISSFGFGEPFTAEARGQYAGYALMATGKLPGMVISALESHPKGAPPHFSLPEFVAQGSDSVHLTRIHNTAVRLAEATGRGLQYRGGVRGYQVSYVVQYAGEQRLLTGAPPEFQMVYDITAPTWDQMQADRAASARANERLIADERLGQDDLRKELQASRRQTELVQEELRRAMVLITQLQAQQARPIAPAGDDKRKNDR